MVATAMLLSACAVATPPFEVPSAERLPALEAAAEADRSDLDIAVALAAGYLQAERFADARRVLLDARAGAGDTPALVLASGLVAERLGLPAAAHADYEAYLAMAPALDRLTPDVRARLDGVRAAAYRQHVAAALEEGPPTADLDRAAIAIAVVPSGGGPTADLARGFGHDAADRLDGSGRRVIDTQLVRALLDALGLGAQDVTVASATTLGRTLGAGTTALVSLDELPDGTTSIQGLVATLGPDEVTVTAIDLSAPLTTLSDATARFAVEVLEVVVDRVRPFEAQDLVRRSFTVTEALRAYGRGLGHTAALEHDAAAAAFLEAFELDPGFDEPRVRAERARRSAELRETSLSTSVGDAARAWERRRAVAALRTRPGSLHIESFGSVGAQERVVAPEILGLDRLGGGVILDVLLGWPGGS